MRALSAASVALVAATLALVACAVTPAAASLLHPLQQRHADLRRGPSRQTQDHHARRGAQRAPEKRGPGFKSAGAGTPQWVFNATSLWEANLGVFNVRHSDVHPGQVLGYAAALSGSNVTSGYIFGLNATTGSELWFAHVTTYVPDQCPLGLIETATTVACLGTVNFAIANRTTGAVVAKGQYAAGFQVIYTQAGQQTRLGDVVALTLYNTGNWTLGKAVALDLASGAVTPMGEVTSAGRVLYTPFPGSLRAVVSGGTQQLEWIVSWWAANTTRSNACNDIFTVTFSTAGAASVVARLPANFSNGAVSNSGSYCPQPAVFAYPDDDVIYGVMPEPFDVAQAYHLNGTFRYAIELPTKRNNMPIVLRPLPRAVSPAFAESVLVQSLCTLASVTQYNQTNWAFVNCEYANSNVVEVAPASITLGGSAAGYLLNVSLATGIAQWDSALYYRVGDLGAQQLTPVVDVFMWGSHFTFVRKSDGARAAAIDVASQWTDQPWDMHFQQQQGAAAGTGTLLVGGLWGNMISVAVTPGL